MGSTEKGGLPELPFPIVLPIFHSPMTLGSPSFLSFRARRGVSCIEMLEADGGGRVEWISKQ